MASLSVTYPSFTSGTTIVSTQVNQNNTDIVNYINARNSGSSTWDVVSTVGAFTSTLTTNQIILGTTRTITISAVTPASSSRIWTIPDITSAGTFAALEGTQTFSGAKTFSSLLTVNAAITATGDIYTTQLTDYSATSSITGWTSFTTKHIFYKLVGKTMTIYFNLTGTSNATTASFTVPVNANSSVDGALNAILISDNGSTPTTPGVGLITNGTPGSVRLFKDWTTPSWTNTGTKTVEGQLTYETV